MQREEIINKINHFLVEDIEIDEAQLVPEARLKADLGIDSLDFVDVAVIIEKTFGFKIKGEELAGVTTLGEFYDFVYRKLN